MALWERMRQGISAIIAHTMKDDYAFSARGRAVFMRRIWLHPECRCVLPQRREAANY